MKKIDQSHKGKAWVWPDWFSGPFLGPAVALLYYYSLSLAYYNVFLKYISHITNRFKTHIAIDQLTKYGRQVPLPLPLKDGSSLLPKS